MRIFLLGKGYDGGMSYSLTKGDRNYLLRSLRLANGDAITARDNRGLYYEATIVGGESLSLRPIEKPETSLTDNLSAYKGKSPTIHLYQCICKGGKNAEIARMACEAGIESITFLSSAFTQERELNSHTRERITSVMREAVQQSGSQTIVREPEVLTFSEAVEKAEGCAIILHQSLRGETKTLKDILSDLDCNSTISLFVGSEGGFSDEECEMAEKKGFKCCLLSTNILRAETAGIYTIGALQTILSS